MEAQNTTFLSAKAVEMNYHQATCSNYSQNRKNKSEKLLILYKEEEKKKKRMKGGFKRYERIGTECKKRIKRKAKGFYMLRRTSKKN